MPIQERVQAGELITADFMNRLLSEISALDQRLAILESVSGGPGLAILGIIPDGPVRINEEMQILGRDFGFLIGAQRVYIHGVRVTNFKAQSSDTLLVFDVPQLPNIPEGGLPVTLSVSNRTTETRTIVVLPAQLALGGQVDVTFENVTPATITAGALATFRYRVVSRANQVAQFTINPTITVSTNQVTWQSVMQVRDDNDVVLPSRLLLINPLQERFFRVVLTSVPTSPAQFQLAVTAAAPGVVANPDSRAFTVGIATPVEDTSITIEPVSSAPPGALAGSSVSMAEGAAARLNLRATFRVAATYDVSAVVISGSSWTIERNTSSTGPTATIPSNEVAGGAEATRNPEFIIRALAFASATGSVEIRIQHQGQATLRTRRFNLVRV